MTEGIRKASNRVRKAGKTVSLGKGSHSVLQRVVGRLIASVQIADERMGFVQVSELAQFFPHFFPHRYLCIICISTKRSKTWRMR